MKRTTQPDLYSHLVHALYCDLKARRIRPLTFATTISIIWSLRHVTHSR